MEEFEYLSCIYNRGDIQLWTVRNKTDNSIVINKFLFFNKIEEANEKYKEVISLFRFRDQKGIAKIYKSELGMDQGRYYLKIVMDYYQRGDLRSYILARIAARTPFTDEEFLYYLRQLVEVFSLFQRSEVAHRDIKPENILVDNDFNLIIADLGSANILKDINLSIAGSPLYLSPKLRQAYVNSLTGSKANLNHNVYKSDVFSLGLTLLYLISQEEVIDLSRTLNENDLSYLIQMRLSRLQSFRYAFSYLTLMLKVDENERPDFVQLYKYLSSTACSYCNNSNAENCFYLGNNILCKDCCDEIQYSIRFKAERINSNEEWRDYNRKIQSKGGNFCVYCLDMHGEDVDCISVNEGKVIPCWECNKESTLSGNWIMCEVKNHITCLVCLKKGGNSHNHCIGIMSCPINLFKKGY